MRTCSLVVVALAAACARESPAPAQDDPQIALLPITKTAPWAGPGDLEPQDLEPVEARRSYSARDADPLLKDIDAVFSMLCMPSFSPAYAVALVVEGDDHPGTKPADRHWTVRFSADPLTEQRRIAKGEDPRRSASVSIDEESAIRLEQAWKSVVRRARYPQPRYAEVEGGGRSELTRVHADGTSYRFESGKFCGATWEPKAELTWGIVELGDALRKYALLDEAARPAQLARCLELAKKLQDAAERRPW